MADPLLDRDALEDSLRLVADEAVRFLSQVDTAPVRPPGPGAPAERLDAGLPAEGDGAAAALRELIEAASEGATRSAGPRFFHFVMGGGTPAALAADWLTSAIDQIAFNWVSSPFAMRTEQIALEWLKELFGSRPRGAAPSRAARRRPTSPASRPRAPWWGLQQGVDVEEEGLADLPPVPVLGSGFVHASAIKALAMLGIGRRRCGRSPPTRAAGSTSARSTPRSRLDGKPAILVATAGDVNSGAFDPLDAMADLAAEHGAWLHVDGAFGLFAAVSPSTRELVRGVERATRSSSTGTSG